MGQKGVSVELLGAFLYGLTAIFVAYVFIYIQVSRNSEVANFSVRVRKASPRPAELLSIFFFFVPSGSD